MTFVHGKNTYVAVSGASLPVTGNADLSSYVKSSEFEYDRDTHDVTTYGKNSHVYRKGLKDSTFKMNGVYDSSTTNGPRAVLLAALDADTTVTLTRRTEGTGSGKPQESVEVLVKKYVETNPVDDMITWSCEVQCSDDVTRTAQ